MTIGRSICRIAIFGTICVGASLFLPEVTLTVAFLSTDEGKKFLTKVAAGIITSVTAGNTANAIDNFNPSRSDYVQLENEDLIRVSGKAIAQIISIASENKAYNGHTRNHLKKIAAKATEAWVSLARFEFVNFKYKELTEGEIPFIITPTEEGLTQTKILKIEEWRTIFAKLDLMAIDSGKGVDLTSDVRQYVAELLHEEFPKILREALKQDFKADGKAFAGLMIQLMTGIRQEVLTNQRKIRKHRKTSLTLLKELRQLKKQLTGTEQQIEKVFIAISDQMQTGFYELCVRFGIVEKNINRNLQQLQDIFREKLDEQSQKLDYIIHVIQRQFSENSDTIDNQLLKALLHLDYRDQVRLFEDFLDTDRIVGAFLIHGSDKSEPHWLVTSLIKKVLNVKTETNNTSDLIINLSFVGNTQSRCLSSIMRQISTQFKLTTPRYSVNDIVQEICKRWESKTIILVIEVEKNIDESFLQEFIDQFWEPLAKSANEMRLKNHNNYNYSLILFMLDIDGCTKSWEISCTEDITSQRIPQLPIKFTKIQPIPRGQLMQWLRTHIFKGKTLEFRDNLLEEMFELNADQESIYQQDVFYRICKIFDIDIKWI